MPLASHKEIYIESTHLDRTITLWTLAVPLSTSPHELKDLKEALKIFPENASNFRTLGHALLPLLGENIDDFSEIYPVSIFSYRGELTHGPYEIYSHEGKLQEKGSYKFGKLHGEFESYDGHGTFTEKGFYTEDIRTGLWFFSSTPEYVWYNEKGHLATSATDFKDAVKTALTYIPQIQENTLSP
jgi:hypothetical protein